VNTGLPGAICSDGKINKLTVNLGPSQLTAEDEGKVRDAVAKARD
jgi:hypothetical protein